MKMKFLNYIQYSIENQAVIFVNSLQNTRNGVVQDIKFLGVFQENTNVFDRSGSFKEFPGRPKNSRIFQKCVL